MTRKAPAKHTKAKAAPKAPKPKGTQPVNYDSMDKEALVQAADEIHVALAEKILQESAKLRTEYFTAVSNIDSAMSKYGITAQEFLNLPKAKLRRAIVARLRGESRRPLAPSYVHPEHSNLTWSGRGSRPRWLRDLLDKGHDLQEFRVPR